MFTSVSYLFGRVVAFGWSEIDSCTRLELVCALFSGGAEFFFMFTAKTNNPAPKMTRTIIRITFLSYFFFFVSLTLFPSVGGIGCVTSCGCWAVFSSIIYYLSFRNLCQLVR